MSTEETVQRLGKLRADRAYVKIERAISGAEVLHGFVLGHSRELVLLHTVREFHLDGYSIVRVRDIDAVRCGRHEKFFLRMLRSEGVVREVGLANRVSLTNMSSALKALAHEDRIVSVECETDDDETFYAGKVRGVKAKSVELRTFDALGTWDAKPDTIETASITLLSWDTEYLRVFAKHLRA